ncbi:hypothetical protein AcW1_000854 [Taiwanofungus camphoratus]|nr:hypothetical protein AcV7_000873 [Antrodia cinnamomea]KAI0963898.1 hypothetical protein AcW1_000854 [Antrodia cinnamomea]
MFLASRLQDGNPAFTKSSPGGANLSRKRLDTQYWLELVDGKHRYGANRTYGTAHYVLCYHNRWRKDNTSENFFRWLDRGGGKDLSLRECPRAQLEKERIIYLSVSQRLNYLVQIDNEGRLRWARNGKVIDTTPGRWKDVGGGGGIVPFDHPGRGSLAPRNSFGQLSSPSSSTLTISGEATAMHYAGLSQTSNPIKRAFRKYFTFHGLLEGLLRKTVMRNTWIYVSDKQCLYLAISLSREL